VHRHPLYYAVRNHIIDFLVSRSRGFAEREGAGHDRRKVPVVRPGVPEPALAPSSPSPRRGEGRGEGVPAYR
jgi:nitrate/nitrite transport system ATP-binding protein